VNVYTLGDVPGTKSAALAISVTAAAYPGATVKAATGDNKPTITTISLVVTAPDTKKFPAGAGNYYIEYTNVADAKGKPDWNAAKVYTTDGSNLTPITMTSGVGNVTISKLDPNSQYFFRVVTAGTAWASSGGWGAQKKIVASKEIKVKTAAVPLPTITKPSLALTTTNDLTLNFTGKSLEQVIAPLVGTAKAVNLGTTPTIVYSVLVSASSTVDKATGKLLAATEVDMKDSTANDGFDGSTTSGITVVDTNGKYNDNLTLSDKGLADLVLTGSGKLFDKLGNASSLKTLNIQLVATINSDLTATTGAVVYSKVAKIALPKWFV
jgi:hypothetical protein